MGSTPFHPGDLHNGGCCLQEDPAAKPTMDAGGYPRSYDMVVLL